MGWSKSLGFFFLKAKDMFLIFTNNSIDLDILSVLLSPAIALLWVQARGAANHLPVHQAAPQHRIIWPKCQ